MKVCHTLICLFFNAALLGGETLTTVTREEGESITVKCKVSYYGSRRYFCKNICEGRNILIETTENRAQNGRYSIRYEDRGKFSSDFLYVGIKELKTSDSGRYRCQTDTWNRKQSSDFYLDVREDSSVKKKTLGPFIRSTFPPVTSTTTSLSSSPSPSESLKLSEKPAAASDLLLYIGLSLGILIFMLAAALLIFFKRKSFGQQKGSPEETEYSNVSNAKDDGVKYSEVHLMTDLTTSANSGHTDVTYSEIHVAASSANNNDDSPLYGNISLRQ